MKVVPVFLLSVLAILPASLTADVAAADENLYMVIDLSDASGYTVSYLDAVPSGGWSDDYKTTKLVLRKVPAGVNPSGDFCITNDMYVGIFEVTQKQWQKVYGTNPSTFVGEKLPVDGVSFSAISKGDFAFLKRLRDRTGISGFELPTIRQWTYASNAGEAVGSYSSQLLHVPSWNVSNSEGTTHEVGTTEPNDWGIYDLYGNVEEWSLAADPYTADYYMTLGGAWSSANNTSGYKDGTGYRTYSDVGFRIYLTLSESKYHTVFYDLGGKGRRSGGGELLQVVKDGEPSVPPTVAVDSGFIEFSKWDVSDLTGSTNMVIHAVYNDVSLPISVEDVSAAQRYPWNDMVDVSWRINDPAFAIGCTYSVALSAIDSIGNTNLAVASIRNSAGEALTQPFECSSTNCSVVWNTDDDLPESTYDLALSVTATPVSTVRSSPILPGEYMVIDISKGPSASSFGVTYLDYTDAKSIPASGWTDEYKTDKIVLRKISAGADPCGRYTLTKDYYVGVFEITQGQWEKVGVSRTFDGYGYYPKDSYGMGDTYPEYGNTFGTMRGKSLGKMWPESSDVDAGSFIGVLRKKTGLTGLDLPTVAQWDYACRAGDTGPHGIGSCAVDAVGDYGWFSGNGGHKTHPVGGKLANAWGLYDMLGNVTEQCLDWWDNESFYEDSYTGTDPVGADGSDALVSGDASRAISGGGQYDAAGVYSLKVYTNGRTESVTSTSPDSGLRLFCNAD